MKLDEQIFVGTEIVDKEKLYAVDQEGFNREVLGLKPQNNDDLFGDSQSNNRSVKKSPKKGKKKKQNQYEDHINTDNFQSVSFVKQE